MDEYLKVMEDIVKPWVVQVTTSCRYVFQQDRALAHSKQTQEWLKTNLPEVWEKEIWHPSLPHCNPLDYFVQGVAHLQVNKAPHSTAASLISNIKEVKGNLDRATVARACKQFRSRLEAIVEADGDFIIE
jgi:hypothetical protein